MFFRVSNRLKNGFLGCIALLAVFIITSILPVQSQAVTGYFLSKRIVKIIGGSVIGLGAVGAVGGTIMMVPHGAIVTELTGLAVAGSGGVLIVGGALILDEKSDRILFGEISQENAKTFGLSESERVSYNEELDLINAINEEIFDSNSEDTSPQAVAERWRQSTQVLSASARAGLAKVSLNFLQKIESVTISE